MRDNVDWNRFPGEEAFIIDHLVTWSKTSKFLARTANRLSAYTATRLIDVTEALILPASTSIPAHSNYKKEYETADYSVYQVSGSLLPKLIIGSFHGRNTGVLLKVEQIAYFQAAHQCPAPISGLPNSAFRYSRINDESNVTVFVCERHAGSTFEAIDGNQPGMTEYQLAWEQWLTRPRRTAEFQRWAEMNQLFEETFKIARKIINLVGTQRAGNVILNAERVYWQARNDLGKALKQTLDYLGIGWINHDHHSFHCSRKYLSETLDVFKLLGFICREKFYTGPHAGWGAQILEHPSGETIFVNVDIAPEELESDFTSDTLPDRDPGPVGLWCQLHGESLFDAGLHHLACRFDTPAIERKILEISRSPVIPVTQFPYLKQAYSSGQRWPVVQHRLDTLVKNGLLRPEKATAFNKIGAFGSHLEVVERNEGFKGFSEQISKMSTHQFDPVEA